MKNHFEIFNISPSFNLDLNELNKRFLILQARCHPDQFNAHTQLKQKNLALQMSVTLNEAKTTLENPAKRAAYCVQLCDFDLSTTKASFEIVQQQFMWQEDLESAHIQANQELIQKVKTEWQLSLKKLGVEFEALFQEIYKSQNIKNIENNQISSDDVAKKLKEKAQNIILLFNFSKNWA